MKNFDSLTHWREYPLQRLHAQIFKGACDAGDVFVHDMGVTFRGFDICMPHEFLQHSYIDTIFQHGGGKCCVVRYGR